MQKPKLPEGFFNPNAQPTTALERDDWFVPIGEGVKDEREPTIQDISSRHEKVKKVIKTILIVFGVVVFLWFGYLAFHEFYR